MKIAKRFLSLVLSLALVLGVMPVFASAVVYEAVAIINGIQTSYDTIEEAVAAAVQVEGSVVRLGMPAEVEEPIILSSGKLTIDLMGYSIANYTYGDVFRIQGATVTFTDSSFYKNGTLKPSMCPPYLNSGIHVESGEVTIACAASDGGFYALTVDGGKVTVNDLKTDEGIVINGGEVVFNGGRMEDLELNGGKTVINGGQFTTTSGTTYIFMLNGGDVEVNGGLFRFCDNYGIRMDNAESDMIIRGGQFTNGLKLSVGPYSGAVDYTLASLIDPDFHVYDETGALVDLSSGEDIKTYVAVAATSPGPRSYHVRLELTGLDSSNTASSVASGQSYTTTFEPTSGYQAPSSITVKMDGKTVSPSNYSYIGGQLTIDAANITGDIEIIANAVEKRFYFAGGTISGASDLMDENGSIWSKTYPDIKPGTQYEAYVYGMVSTGTVYVEPIYYNVDTPCDVTISYDTATGELSVTGEGVSPYVPPTYTLYYDNSKTGWDEVYIYTWSGDGDWATKYTGNWPGTKMELGEGETDI